jgi:hypothetical protein
MNLTNTRRWPRYHVYLPVLITVDPKDPNLVVPGLISELSQSGMEIYGGVNRRLGDEMEIEFKTSRGGVVRIAGIVRSRTGFCFGIEFCGVRTRG